jgi:hypothetical protein
MHKLAVAFALGIVVTATSSHADPPPPVREQGRLGADWNFMFTDDLLSAGSALANAPPVAGFGIRRFRAILIRPRTQFVSEMLKSVEGM